MLASVFVVDGVLRVFAQTRFLLAQNVLHLAIVAGLAGFFLNLFGLQGAVLATLLATLTVKSIGMARIAHLMHLRWQDALLWRALMTAASCAVIATIPAFAISRNTLLPPLTALPGSCECWRASAACGCWTASASRTAARSACCPT